MVRPSALCCVLASCMTARGAALPEVTAGACRAAPKIDGELGDSCWGDAGVASDFLVLGGKGRRTDATKAYLTADATWLYLGFACSHPRPNRLEQKVRKHDGPVHTDDSVEAFIDPGTSGKVYFQYILSFANVRAEKRVSVRGGRETGWDVPWRSATKVTDEGWNAEVAIPLLPLLSDGDLGNARINLCRNAVVAAIDPYGMKTDEKTTLSSWSPAINEFHEPDRFGLLKGMDGLDAAAPFLPALENVKVGRQYSSGRMRRFDAVFDLRGYSNATGRVKVLVVDKPRGRKGEQVSQVIQVRGKEPQSLKLSVPVPPLEVCSHGERKVEVTMQDAETGEQLQHVVIADTSALKPMTTYLDRSFYTTEEAAGAICSFAAPADQLAQALLVAKDEKGAVLAVSRQVAPRTELRIPLGQLPCGSHRIRIEYTQRAAGEAPAEPVAAQDVVLTRRPPKPGHEWKIDRVNRVLLNNGQPYFPCGFVMTGVFPHQEMDFAAVAGAGFNTIWQWITQQDPDMVHKYFRVAAKHGLMVVAHPDSYARGVELETLSEYVSGERLERLRQYAGRRSTHTLKFALGADASIPLSGKTRIHTEFYEKNRDRIRQAIKNASGYRNLLGYEFYEEGNWTFQYEAGMRIYSDIYELDGYHPTHVLCGYPQGDVDYVTEWDDLIGYDPYWVPTSPTAWNGSANYVSKVVDGSERRGERYRRPTYTMLLSEIRSGMDKRPLMPDEQFCQTYLALIHGAKGLYWFVYPIRHRANWTAFKQIGKQLKQLGPIAVTPPVPQDVAYKTLKAGPRAPWDKYPDVQVALHRNPAGGYVLLACNSRPYGVETAYRLSCLNDGDKVGRLFSDRDHVVTEGGFTERMERYATRAYTFPHIPEVNAPVKIEVVTSADLTGYEPEVIVPRPGRPGKKNIARNPGFEDATNLPGWPDYYMTVWLPQAPQDLVGQPDPLWGRDTTDPFQGQYCLRIANVPGVPVWNAAQFFVSPQHDVSTQYVFSTYLRADKNGTRARLDGPGGVKKEIKLTTEWKRFHVAGHVPAKASPYSSCFIFLHYAERGRTIWADAVQFERGPVPTEFEN